MCARVRVFGGEGDGLAFAQALLDLCVRRRGSLMGISVYRGSGYLILNSSSVGAGEIVVGVSTLVGWVDRVDGVEAMARVCGDVQVPVLLSLRFSNVYVVSKSLGPKKSEIKENDLKYSLAKFAAAFHLLNTHVAAELSLG